MNIEMGTTFDVASNINKCVKCGLRGWQDHHITYIPEELSKLCDDCHKEITTLNRIASRRVPRGHPYRPLSNKMRRRIYTRWLNG